MNSYNCDDQELSFDIREIGDNKFVLVKADEEKGIKEIKIERYGKNVDDKKKIKKENKKRKIICKEISCESDSDSEEEQKDEKVKTKKIDIKKEKNKRLLGKKKKYEKDIGESNNENIKEIQYIDKKNKRKK